MEKALKLASEIKHLQSTMYNGSSKHRHNYQKAIRRKTADLKEYCQYKNFNYKEIMGGNGK